MTNPLADDLEHILRHTGGLWDELRHGRLFVTGGTGFLGCWLLESFLWANDVLGLGAEICVLTRDPSAFRVKAPHLANHSAVTLLAGDARCFDFPAGSFSHVIHAAAEPSARLNARSPLLLLDTIVDGTRRVLDFAVACRARSFLFVSSGAVYGPPTCGLSFISEDYGGAPDPLDPLSAYASGKRMAEHLCALYHQRSGLETKIARCFSVVGPYLPLDGHFAVSCFLRDSLAGGAIRVLGDGTAKRSYIYAGDLALWLWTILVRGAASRPYNVGSDRVVSIEEVARLIASEFSPPPEVRLEHGASATSLAGRSFVPSIERAKSELQLDITRPLPDALRRTVCWLLADRLRGQLRRSVGASMPAGDAKPWASESSREQI